MKNDIEDNAEREANAALGNPNRTHKKKQLIGVGVLLIAVTIAIIAAINRSSKPIPQETALAPKKFKAISESISPHEDWVMHAEHDVETQRQFIEALQKHQVDQDKVFDEKITMLNDKTSELIAKINQLEDENNALKSLNASIEQETGAFASPKLPRLRTVYIKPKKTEVPKTPETYVPSGSTVNAVLLSGVDASVSVNSSSDPRPVLIRLTGKGSLPNGAYSHLKDCRLTGAADGDISSSRAHVRLERLSCQQLGEYREFTVNGYVTGIDGKEGIRGRVVMQDSALMSRAFMGGVAGGLSKAAANSMTVQSFSPEGSVSTVKSANAFGYAGASGVSDGLDSYAKYQIKRAEQYQPVIEVGSGTRIDVVFKEGFYLDGFKQTNPGTRKNEGADFNQVNEGFGQYSGMPTGSEDNE